MRMYLLLGICVLTSAASAQGLLSRLMETSTPPLVELMPFENAVVAAKAGDGAGYYAVALHYAIGNEIESDGEIAAKYLAKAVAAKYPAAIFVDAMLSELRLNTYIWNRFSSGGLRRGPRIADGNKGPNLYSYTRVPSNRNFDAGITSSASFTNEADVAAVRTRYETAIKSGVHVATNELARFEKRVSVVRAEIQKQIDEDNAHKAMLARNAQLAKDMLGEDSKSNRLNWERDAERARQAAEREEQRNALLEIQQELRRQREEKAALASSPDQMQTDQEVQCKPQGGGALARLRQRNAQQRQEEAMRRREAAEQSQREREQREQEKAQQAAEREEQRNALLQIQEELRRQHEEKAALASSSDQTQTDQEVQCKPQGGGALARLRQINQKQRALKEEQKERLKKEKEEENILRSTVEEIIGFKFGQAPITGVDEKIIGPLPLGHPVTKTQTLKLAKSFRHMKDVVLTYYNNKLTTASLFVCFGHEYSDDAIEQELNTVYKKLAEKLGFDSKENMCQLNRGRFSVQGGFFEKKLSLTFTDNQILEAEITAARKKGRPLPKLPEEL